MRLASPGKRNDMEELQTLLQSGAILTELCIALVAIIVFCNWVWKGIQAFMRKFRDPTDEATKLAKKVEEDLNEYKKHTDSALKRDLDKINKLDESDRLILKGHMAIISYMINDDGNKDKLIEASDSIHEHLLNR